MKKNNKYWEQRANERMTEYHKNSDKTIAQVNTGYDKAINTLNSDIENVFYNFSKNHNLTPDDAQKILNSPISKTELDKIRSTINDIESPIIKKRLLAQLNAKAYKARITRLEALKESAYINSKVIADAELKKSTLGYIDSINQAYYRNIFDIQKGTGLAFEFAAMPSSNVEEILLNNWSGYHYSKRIWHNTDVLAQSLQETITSGLMSGKSYARMSRELVEHTDYGKFAAERLIRTETTYVTNAAEAKSYKECDIEKYVFIATLDLRTSDECRDHDGKIFEVSKSEAGENRPPLHPFCRSTTRAYFEGMESLQRRARDPETGEMYTIPGNMNYNEWYQKYVIDKHGKQKAEYFEKTINNKASDKEQYKRYKSVLGKDIPTKSFDDFQNLKYNKADEWASLKGDYRKTNAYNKIIANEPAITSHLIEISKNTDSKLVGLEYKLKTKESYMRKVGIDSKNSLDPAVIQETIGSTNDVIRYTFQASHDNLVEKYFEINKQLTEKEYSQIKVKNTWLIKNSPYKGINCIYTAPSSQKFEIQFHTPESFAVKNGEMHRLYEEWRVLPKDSDKRTELEAAMKKLSDSMVPPNDIERVK